MLIESLMRKHQSNAIQLCLALFGSVWLQNLYFLGIKINLQIHITFRYFTFAVISCRKIYYAFQIRSVILCE